MINFFTVEQPDNKAYISPELTDGQIWMGDQYSLTLLDGDKVVAAFKPSEWLSVYGTSSENNQTQTQGNRTMSDIKEIMAKTVDRSRILRTSTSEQMQAAIKALDAAGYQIVPKKVVEGYAECIDDMADWASYAGDYFQKKHDIEGDINRHKAMLTTAKEEQNDE